MEANYSKWTLLGALYCGCITLIVLCEWKRERVRDREKEKNVHVYAHIRAWAMFIKEQVIAH